MPTTRRGAASSAAAAPAAAAPASSAPLALSSADASSASSVASSSRASSPSRPSAAAGTSAAAHEEDQELEALFAASVAAHEAKLAAARQAGAFTADNDIVRLDGSVAAKTAPLPQASLDKGKQPAAAETAAYSDAAVDRHLSRLESGEALADARARRKGSAAAKREAQAKRALSAGPGWFDMPAFPGAATSKGSGMNVASASSKYVSSARGATAEEMRREVQAIRLRNAMDPKRFYRGGKADKGMPKFAQLGRIVGSELEPSSIVTGDRKGRSVVEEVVRDAEAAAYAKRKFGEQQERNASGGRGYLKAKSKKPKHKR